MSELVVRSERVVLPGGMRAAAIHIRDGRIAALAAYAETAAGVRQIDARELMILPGLVDTHVHMNDPGRAHWEGVEHATRAAAAGGITTIVDMPLNCIPATTNVAALYTKRTALRGRCHVDVGFWGGVVPGNVSDLEPLANAGVLGFKCFLCPSGVGEFAYVTEADLREAMPKLARLGLPLLAHAELPDKLRDPDATAPRKYGTWLASRPPEAETEAIALLIALAEQSRARIHIVHLACAEPLASLRAARARGVAVSAETCPHYLTFAAEDVEQGATPLKCAPPIRERNQRERLWEAVRDGDIDLIASDHSPAPPAHKCLEEGDFLRAWGGIASLQIALPAIWTGAAGRSVSIDRIVRCMASAPACLAGLAPRKGAISAGADADLVFFDPDAESVVDPRALHHRHPVTPYAGMALRGAVRTTLLRGEVIFKDGEVMQAATGQMIGSQR